jgi:hypothetical protein
VAREELVLRPGGYGILLAQNSVDELIYNERGNDVVMIKYLDQKVGDLVACRSRTAEIRSGKWAQGQTRIVS